MADKPSNGVGRALISVSDKTGLVELARGLVGQGVTILSTGGTSRALDAAGIAVVDVQDHTGFPEMMDGRVKTLHPKVHGGILARRGTDDDVLARHDIAPIDLVVVNLYPFEETIARPGCAFADAVEQIDIGGPAMVRSAAKNHAHVLVVVDPADYVRVLAAMAAGRPDGTLRRELAAKAFRHTAAYDSAIGEYLDAELYPERLTLSYRRVDTLRYGENPHQSAAFYAAGAGDPSLADARQLQGKRLSFNNLADTDAALECLSVFERPTCVIVKHANPCGVASAEVLCDAYDRAFDTDPTSAFGGIIAFNRALDERTAARVVERQFFEVLAAPSVTSAAVEVLSARPNVRVLEVAGRSTGSDRLAIRQVAGGLLAQQPDRLELDAAGLKVATDREPTAGELDDLRFAWRVAWFVKSNAIVYARGASTVGVGAGQMSRVVSARIAAMKAEDAGLDVAGSVMASDAFFPFRDGIDAAAEAGITAVIQPGGSVRDDEVVAAANEHGMAMVFTGVRHFRH